MVIHMLMTCSCFVSLRNKCIMRIVLHLGEDIQVTYCLQIGHIELRRKLHMYFKNLYHNLYYMDLQIVHIKYSHLEHILHSHQDTYLYCMTSIPQNNMQHKSHTLNSLEVDKYYCLKNILQNMKCMMQNQSIFHNQNCNLNIIDCQMINNSLNYIMYM